MRLNEYLIFYLCVLYILNLTVELSLTGAKFDNPCFKRSGGSTAEIFHFVRVELRLCYSQINWYLTRILRSPNCVDAMDGMITIIWYEGLCGWTEVEITLTARK